MVQMRRSRQYVFFVAISCLFVHKRERGANQSFSANEILSQTVVNLQIVLSVADFWIRVALSCKNNPFFVDFTRCFIEKSSKIHFKNEHFYNLHFHSCHSLQKEIRFASRVELIKTNEIDHIRSARFLFLVLLLFGGYTFRTICDDWWLS